MAIITLTCTYCGAPVQKYDGEVRRQLKKGKTNFFCNTTCSVKYGNALRPNRRVEVEKICLYCKTPFKTKTGCKSPVYCSRGCASAGSMSEERREAQRQAGLKSKTKGTPVSMALIMKKREHWKYTKIAKFLELMKEDFEFEFILENYIYDLFLKGLKILIEFDSSYHNMETQKTIDRIKDEIASKNGFNLIRIKTPVNTIIDPELIYEIVKPK